MRNVSSIDTDDILYTLVKQAVTKRVVKIGGGVYTANERPDGSKANDIVVNTITVSHEKPQTGSSNINIYAEDLKLKIKGQEQWKTDRETLRKVGDALVDYLDACNVSDLEFWIEYDVVVPEPTTHQHYRNIRIGWNIH